MIFCTRLTLFRLKLYTFCPTIRTLSWQRSRPFRCARKRRLSLSRPRTSRRAFLRCCRLTRARRWTRTARQCWMQLPTFVRVRLPMPPATRILTARKSRKANTLLWLSPSCAQTAASWMTPSKRCCVKCAKRIPRLSTSFTVRT